MKFRKEHQPTSEEERLADELMTEEQKKQSKDREAAFDSLKPPSFDQNSGTILFNLDRRLIDTNKRLRSLIQREGFEPKNEFHVTIFGFRKGREIKDALNRFSSAERSQRTNQLNSLIANTDWALASTPKLYRVRKEYPSKTSAQKFYRETIVQTLDLKELENFSKALGNILNIKLKPQFPHLTLFTRGNDPQSRMGIGIDTKEDFDKLNPQQIELEK